MNRLLDIQFKFLKKIDQYEAHSMPRDESLDWEKVHMISCAKIGQVLAIKRGVDPELAALACVFHDFGRLITGRQENHAEAGYEPLKEYLQEFGNISSKEIEIISLACKNHSNKGEVGTPIEEIVKDADVLDCYQYGLELPREEQKKRLKNVLNEIGNIR